MDGSRRAVEDALAAAGCVAPAAEAAELLRASASGGGAIDELVARRVRGEPLAWVTGGVDFCGIRVRVDPGVYVPRPHTEALARMAAALLPADGIAVDLCTGSGAVAAAMETARPNATVLATDRDPLAVACAAANGVDALAGDLDEPLPIGLEGRVDVLTAVVPYVPTDQMRLLPRDVLAFEPHGALDGGPSGTDLLERVVRLAPRWLARGGHLLLELGGDQADDLAPTLAAAGLSTVRMLRDEDGQARGIDAMLPRMNGTDPNGRHATTWGRFAEAEPELARFGAGRLARSPAYLATIRRSGAPRVHPVTPILTGKGLYLFMEPTSPKRRDLLDRGRYALHNGVPDHEGTGGEFTVSGTAVAVGDPRVRAEAADAAGYDPAAHYVLFELMVEEARCIGTGTSRCPRTGDGGRRRRRADRHRPPSWPADRRSARSGVGGSPRARS